MGEHSPTPWKLVNSAAMPGSIVSDDGGHRTRVAEMCGSMSNPEVAADAAFLVKAVNLHDEMVEALNAADRYFARYHEAVGRAPASVMTANKIRSALAKASPTPRKVTDPTGSER